MFYNLGDAICETLLFPVGSLLQLQPDAERAAGRGPKVAVVDRRELVCEPAILIVIIRPTDWQSGSNAPVSAFQLARHIFRLECENVQLLSEGDIRLYKVSLAASGRTKLPRRETNVTAHILRRIRVNVLMFPSSSTELIAHFNSTASVRFPTSL